MPKGMKLQWAPTTPETAEAAQAYDFFRVGEQVVLLYGGKAHEMFSVADDKFLRTMTAEEAEWLKESIDKSVWKRAAKKPEAAYQNDVEFMQAFERELAKEKAMMEGKEVAGDGGDAEYKAENQQK